MTIPQAKKDAANRLMKSGIPYESLRGYSVDFIDLARCKAVFVEVKGIDFQVAGVLEKWDTVKTDIPRPSAGGYILRSKH